MSGDQVQLVNSEKRYVIVETDLGPLISESRVSAFDVMDAHENGDSLYDICATFNLTPLQVETALTYIEHHRADLEVQLNEIRQSHAAREQFYRSQASEVSRRVAAKSLTPARVAVMALRDRSPIDYTEHSEGANAGRT